MPTYKFIEGKADYVFTKAKKLPSYTDRVLFRCIKENKKLEDSVIVEEYDSQKIFLSDHIPLICVVRLIK